MRRKSGQIREKLLLDAMGNLPEDMIAKAAEYSPDGRNTEEQEEEGDAIAGEEEFWKKKAGRRYRKMLCRGLAAAACLGVVIIGADRGGRYFQKYSNKNSVVSEQKEVRSQNASKLHENSLKKSSEERELEVKIWAVTAGAGKETASSSAKKKTDKDIVNHQEMIQNADFGKKEMKEGVSQVLQVEEVDGGDGERIPVVKLVFGDESENQTYSLYSQISKIVSVTEDGVTKYVNLPNADCKSGGVAEFDTRRFAEVSWEKAPVPEWAKKKIDVLDIINISVKSVDGKEQEAGKFVLGIKGEKYYGLFTKTVDK